jgi:Ca-activated chloride channel family protein
MQHAGLQASDGEAIPLRDVSIAGEVIGGYAHIRVRQRYQHIETRPVEAVYTFPLPADATLMSFAMECQGQRFDGVVQEREEAFRRYDDAVTAGHGGALLEQERANVFTVSVGNILPREETIIEVSYAQRLQASGGALRCMIPTVVAPRYIPGTPQGDRTSGGWAEPTDRVPDADRITPQIGEVRYGLTLSIVFDLGRALTIESPSHALHLTAEDGWRVRVTLAHEHMALDRDLILIARGPLAEPFTAVTLHHAPDATTTEPAGVLALTVVPDLVIETGKPIHQDVVFVIDVSGSMAGPSLHEAKATLQRCLRHLRAGDRFNLIAFHNQYALFSLALVPFSPESLVQADQWLNGLVADGGTEILAPLLEAVRQVPDGVVMLLTDGQVGNESEICAQVLRTHAHTRIYTFGIGTVVSEVLLHTLAQRTGGAVEWIYPGENLAEKVEAQFARAIAPRITNVALSCSGADFAIMDPTPAELPALVAGEPWVIFARFQGTGHGQITIQGRLGEEAISLRVPVDCAHASPRPLLEKYWATERIREWELTEVVGRRAERMKDRIVDLSVKHGILSAYTALVVIEERSGERRASRQPVTHFIPVHAPAGWNMVTFQNASGQHNGGAPMSMQMRGSLDLRLQQKLQQRLVITPQLRQAIKILQLQREELETLIDEELADNPVLERLEEEETVTASPQERTEETTSLDVPSPTPQDDMNWQQYLDQYTTNLPSLPATGSDDEDDDRLTLLENLLTRGESLAEHLSEQLRFQDLSADEERITAVIIGNLDVDGYLKASLEELAKAAGVTMELAAYVLQLIQSCDPIGVAARDLRECLLLQLRAQAQETSDVEDPVLTLAIRIVQDHLTALEGRRFDRLAKDVGMTVEEVIHAVKLITTLEPKPARNFSEGKTQYVTPDVEVRKMGDEYHVTLNDEGLPRLRVSQSYQRLLAEGGEAKDYIQDKLRSAAWLVKSIQQRQHTLLQVAQSIVKFQTDFLTYGVSHLHPLTLRDVAEEVRIHESTVSRAIANKYMATPRGIIALKRFFSTKLKQRHGDDVSAESVKDQIRALIAGEDAASPYSDEAIARQLSRGNIVIARRTVAKYREAMQIPSSARRAQLCSTSLSRVGDHTV